MLLQFPPESAHAQGDCPRVSALMKGKINKFCVDSLMAITYKLGLDESITISEYQNEIVA